VISTTELIFKFKIHFCSAHLSVQLLYVVILPWPISVSTGFPDVEGDGTNETLLMGIVELDVPGKAWYLLRALRTWSIVHPQPSSIRVESHCNCG
jgi:hypothetical protein